MELIKGIKVPGVVWVILIVVGVAIVHENTTNPLYYDLAIMAAGMLLRSVTNNRAELTEYQEMLQIVRNQLQRQRETPPPNSETRSSRDRALDKVTVEAADLHIESLKQPPPSPIMRFLFG